MNNICAWISLIAGLYFVVASLIINANDFASALFFKVVPFFLGTGCLFVAVKLFDIIAFK